MKKVLILILLLLSGTAYGADNLKTAFEEGNLSGEFRTFYFARDYDRRTDREDFATGGMLYYRTAPLKGINMGLAFYTGQGMGLNNDDKDVYGLLASAVNGDHRNYSALGEAYLQSDLLNTKIKIGRQEVETPWINGDDNRLTPQSFQGITAVNNSFADLEIYGAYITKMKEKASSDFSGVLEFAGLTNVKRSVSVMGLTYSRIENLKLQFWDYYVHDLMNNIYFRTDYSRKISDAAQLFFNFQYLDQSDTGDRLGGNMDTYEWAIEGGVEYSGTEFFVSYARVGDQDILYPWGHDFMVSAMINDVSRAKEKAFMFTLAYDFGAIELPGLEGKIVHADFNTPDSGAFAGSDFTETDLELRYRFRGKFEGLSLRARYGIINQDEALLGEDYNDLRFYITMNF